MSIHIILGRPGSGKSMYATQRVMNELVEGNRNIVTNLPLRPDILNEYIQKRFPTVNTQFVDRLRIMSDDEMRHFWDFRGPPTDDNPNGDDKGRGVAYFLDEAHIAFNARDWATLGRSAIHYMSQHRKLGDIVWPITQACGNLDKQFRSVAEDYTVLRNEYTAKLGIFRGMGRFVRKSYYSEPQGKAEPFETATFTIDRKGIAACYDTAKGIGVHGSKADIGRRAKGIPIWWIFPAMLLGACSIVFVPMLMGRAASKFIAGNGAKQIASAYTGATQAPGHPPTGAAPSAPVLVPPSEPKPKQEPPPKKVAPQVTGYLVAGGRFTVQLANGEQIQDTDGRLGGYRRGRVLVDGVWVTPQGKPAAEGGKISHIIYKRNLDGELIPVTVEVQSSSDGGTNNQPQIQNENAETRDKDGDRGHPESRPESSDGGTTQARGKSDGNPRGVQGVRPHFKARTTPVRH